MASNGFSSKDSSPSLISWSVCLSLSPYFSFLLQMHDACLVHLTDLISKLLALFLSSRSICILKYLQLLCSLFSLNGGYFSCLPSIFFPQFSFLFSWESTEFSPPVNKQPDTFFPIFIFPFPNFPSFYLREKKTIRHYWEMKSIFNSFLKLVLVTNIQPV